MVYIQELFTDEIFRKWNRNSGDYDSQEHYVLKFNDEPVFYVEVPYDEDEHYQLLHGREAVAKKLRELFGTEIEE